MREELTVTATPSPFPGTEQRLIADSDLSTLAAGAVLTVVYRLHFARSCLSSLYTIIVNRRGHRRAKSQPLTYSQSASTSSASNTSFTSSDELHEEKLREATSLQLKNALLMKSLEGQSTIFNINFATELKPYISSRLGTRRITDCPY